MVHNGDCTLKTRFFTDGLFNLVLVWFLNQEHHSALNLRGLPQLLTSTCAMCIGDYDWLWMLSDVGMCIVICQYFLNYTFLSSRPGATSTTDQLFTNKLGSQGWERKAFSLQSQRSGDATSKWHCDAKRKYCFDTDTDMDARLLPWRATTSQANWWYLNFVDTKHN